MQSVSDDDVRKILMMPGKESFPDIII